MLFSNMGFTIASHYCRGHLVKTQLVHGAQSFGCCMAKMTQELVKECESPTVQKPVNKKGCCENTYQSLELDEDYSLEKQVLTKADVQLVAVFVYTYLHLVTPDGNTDIATSHPSPPLLKQDIQVLHQTFLL